MIVTVTLHGLDWFRLMLNLLLAMSFQDSGSPNEQDCIVRATDVGGQFTDVPVQIDVRSDTDPYEVPTFLGTPYQVTIREDSMSQEVLLVSVEGAAQVGFNIIRGSRPSTNYNRNFGLSNDDNQFTTSYITVLEALDFESVERWVFFSAALNHVTCVQYFVFFIFIFHFSQWKNYLFMSGDACSTASESWPKQMIFYWLWRKN